MSTNASGFPQRLKQARKGAEHTQVSFAAALGVTPRAVQHWEQGVRLPRTEHWAGIQALTGRPFQWFFEDALVERHAQNGKGVNR